MYTTYIYIYIYRLAVACRPANHNMFMTYNLLILIVTRMLSHSAVCCHEHAACNAMFIQAINYRASVILMIAVAGCGRLLVGCGRLLVGCGVADCLSSQGDCCTWSYSIAWLGPVTVVRPFFKPKILLNSGYSHRGS